MTLFSGFTPFQIDLPDARIAGVQGGAGSPLVLLHGFPQTHVAWHALAPLLAAHHRVIVPDLRGYGASIAAASGTDAGMSKRVIATEIVALMAALGHREFDIAGHDRGGRVAYRLALDHPQAVRKLALLDILSTLDTWEAMDWQAALRAYHWPFLAQDAAFVTHVIGADPARYLDHLLNRWKGRGAALAPAALAAYHASIAQPATIAAMAADYRAGATLDVDADRTDREAGRRISAPILLLRGQQYEARALAPHWQAWGPVAAEHVFDCGHFIAEEATTPAAAALAAFFGEP